MIDFVLYNTLVAAVVSILMAAENPAALTWIFSHQVADPDDYAAEFDSVHTLQLDSRVQYLAYHAVEHADTGNVYIRGIVRFIRQTTLRQLKSLLATASYKPLRGVFSSAVVADKLRSTNRISQLSEFGSIDLSSKRSRECNNTCICCKSNKLPKPSS